MAGSQAAGLQVAGLRVADPIGDFPRRRPAAKTAITTPTTPSVISTQAHQGRPPESVVGGVVCVAWTLTVADLAIDAVPG